jgi:hypothetical protein
MDPDANLEEQLRIVSRLMENDYTRYGSMVESTSARACDADRLADLVLALDEWLEKGGFLPRRWSKNRGIPNG